MFQIRAGIHKCKYTNNQHSLHCHLTLSLKPFRERDRQSISVAKTFLLVPRETKTSEVSRACRYWRHLLRSCHLNSVHDMNPGYMPSQAQQRTWIYHLIN